MYIFQLYIIFKNENKLKSRRFIRLKIEKIKKIGHYLFILILKTMFLGQDNFKGFIWDIFNDESLLFKKMDTY